MMTHVTTLAVKAFGNSVIFGDRLGEFPIIFQPFLFYPDWFFMTWPAHFVVAMTTKHSHPYIEGMGPLVFGFGFVWLILGIILGRGGASNTVTSIATIRFVHINRNFISKLHTLGILGQLIGLPLVIFNGLYCFVYKLFVYALFWHIVIGRAIGIGLTHRDWIGRELSSLVRGLILIAMIVPPTVVMLIEISMIVIRASS